MDTSLPRGFGLRLIIFTATLLALASPARADWQFTKWGMTPEQVEKASAGRAPLISPREFSDSLILNAGEYRSGEHHFNAEYLYKDRRLTGVHLRLKSDTCGLLKSDLKARYGKPDDIIRLGVAGATWFWTDSKNGNGVTLLDAIGTCTVMYAKANRANRKGL